MASTFGHALAGLALYLAFVPKRDLRQRLQDEKAKLVGFMALANVPDLDLLIGFLFYKDPHQIHGGITHGLPFAIVTAGVLALVCPALGSFLRSFQAYVVVVGSHAGIDLLTSYQGVGFQTGAGLSLFSPIVSQKISLPLALFFGVSHKHLSQIVSLHNLWVVCYEGVVFSVLIVLVMHLKAQRSGR